jgi:hypothetical protein
MPLDGGIGERTPIISGIHLDLLLDPEFVHYDFYGNRRERRA